MARNAFALSSPELTKTRSSQMIGVAAEGPGNCVDHFTFFVLENSVGRLPSVVDPLKKGPRHCVQFSAWAGVSNVANINASERDLISSASFRRGNERKSKQFGCASLA